MSEKKVELYYYKYPNFGDQMNEMIMKKLGIEMTYRNFDNADLIAIGSIMDKVFHNSKIGDGDKSRQKQANTSKPIYVWGTGLMYQYGDDANLIPIRPFDVKALRGELTRKQVSKALGKEVRCVLGDPGILASYFVREEAKEFDVGIIPHYVDENDPVFEVMKNTYPNAVIIDVHEDCEEVLKKISRCRKIFSTSLHGIIAADSYGIPNCWCESSDRILGSGYKYHDYFSAFGTDRQPFDLRNGDIPDPDQVCALTASPEQIKKRQKELLNCFPYLKTRNPLKLLKKLF